MSACACDGMCVYVRVCACVCASVCVCGRGLVGECVKVDGCVCVYVRHYACMFLFFSSFVVYDVNQQIR